MRAELPAGARDAAAHVFVDDLERPALSDDDAHHLGRVLRVRPGEAVSAADGRGGWRLCRLGAGGALDASGPVVAIPAPEVEVTIAFAVPKGDRAEWAVQKLTEVGVDRIVPLVAARAVVRWDQERARRHLAKWRAVARQTAMQSRRARIPSIGDPMEVAGLAAGGPGGAPAGGGGPGGSRGGAPVGAAAALGPREGVAMADPAGAAGPGLGHPTVLVGPEGGWSPAELGLGVPLVSLGPTVLRTETAAVVAATLLAAARAGLLPPSADHVAR